MTSELNNPKHKLVTENSRRELRWVVEGLNGENPRLSGEDRASFVRFVEAWNEAKRNPWKMNLSREDEKRFSMPNLEKVWRLHLARIGRTSETEHMVRDLERRKIWVRDDPAGGAYWWISPTGENSRDTAAFYVSMLVTNPMRGKLSDGPCTRPRCGKWFVKRRPAQMQCSRRCLGIVRSVAATKVERREAKKKALKQARRALRSWRRRSGTDWKTYVSLATKLTKKFLTRAVTNKELREPRRQA
jgi:hypothetical protein